MSRWHQDHLPDDLAKEIHLSIEKLASQYHVSREIFANMQVDVSEACRLTADPLFRSIALTLSLRVPTHTLAREAFPATWWDAFKDAWFPAWALQRWPIKKRMVTVKAVIGGIPLKQAFGDRHTIAYMAQLDGKPLQVSSRDRMEESMAAGEYKLSREEMDKYLSISPEERKLLDGILNDANTKE